MKKKPSLVTALIILLGILTIITYSIFILQTEPHIPLVICIVLLAIIAMVIYGHRWDDVEKGLISGIKIGLKPILILALVGMVIAVWMMSGTVPTLLHIGFTVISPEWFALSALFICILVSSFTGSSFTTIGTVGVALMGIGVGLGIHPGLAAGAIISGACFGDKMSPLSDTTNFAPGIVNVDLFSHIRHLLWTTIPSLIVTVILFSFLGRKNGETVALTDIEQAKLALTTNFELSWLTLLSPLLVFIFAINRRPTIPVLVIGIVSGIITALMIQTNITMIDWLTVLQRGFSIETGNDVVDGIVNRGGLQSMMWSISLIMIALGLGGVIQAIGIIDAFIDGLKHRLNHRGHLIASTAGTSIGVNVLTGEQYLSILLPGQNFKPFYEKMNLHPKNLSRTVEDAGTLVNPLIPWGVSGAFFYSTLGVPVIDYAPYAFFLLLSPLFTILFGYLGIGIAILKRDG
ncbi:Na+/H+ antiporter NhaC [Anaerobacillus sp. MEB173]|uniref:Na+/H+ antiporter NhaC n=1 Tax=Anaerobacillus sp. MEB173 TaxID=3383345 RepID=UPI003F9165F9